MNETCARSHQALRPVSLDASESAKSADAWLVDLDGTLYNPHPVRALMAAELLLSGVRHVALLREFRQQHEHLRRTLREPVANPFALQISRTAQALGCSEARVEAAVRRWMIERPTKWLRLSARKRLLTELAAFRRNGGRLGLVSDYPARHKLRAFRAWVEFDVVVANGEQGGPRRLKPHPDGYLKAAAALCIPPQRCLVIGDRPDADGRAAEAASMAFRLVG